MALRDTSPKLYLIQRRFGQQVVVSAIPDDDLELMSAQFADTEKDAG